MTSDTQVIEKAAALLIGNELLSGKVRDQNLHELARCLRALGISLERAVFVLDDIPSIAREMRQLSHDFPVVFTSGGVGPTHDDVTVVAAAEAFSAPLVHHPELVAVLREAYGEAFTDDHLLMARVPSGAQLVYGPELRWPVVVINNVWLLPGIPEIFRSKLGIVRAQLRGSAPFYSFAVNTLVDEPALLAALNTVVAAHPDVEIGSYPRWLDPSCKTQITFDARDKNAMERAVCQFLTLLPPGAEPRGT